MDPVPRLPIARLPAAAGVYRFRDAEGKVLYIGRATTLRSRVASYWSDLKDRRHLVPMVAKVSHIEATICESPHEAAWLERNLLETSLPPWNKTPGGQETIVYLRLDQRPATAGLSAGHTRRPEDQARYFGPYLGGQRVRQAASGLNRILPLACTSTSVNGAERDMARARGFLGADRAELAAGIAAILERQPDAVAWARAELTRLRERAAAELAFELAGRLQSEIQGLDWVTSPQRVTSLDARDFDVCGWSGGMMVRFGICAGRLCQWSQVSRTRARSARLLAATPAEWAGFAQANADLAAALAG